MPKPTPLAERAGDDGDVQHDPRHASLVHQPATAAENGLDIRQSFAASIASAPQSFAFEITVDKRGGKLGLDLVPSYGGMRVVNIMPGRIEEYNQVAPKDERILMHDTIRAANGTSDIKEMMDKLVHAELLILEVVRPDIITVSVKRLGKPWGLVIAFQNSSACIEVRDLAPGALRDHNTYTADEQLQVKPFDLIYFVNGVCGSSEKMVEEVKRSDVLDLSLLRLNFVRPLF